MLPNYFRSLESKIKQNKTKQTNKQTNKKETFLKDVKEKYEQCFHFSLHSRSKSEHQHKALYCLRQFLFDWTQQRLTNVLDVHWCSRSF